MMQSETSKPALTIVGCGVSGLTCGIRLLESGFAVTIVARDLPPHTTSNVAAAIWYPYKAYPEDRVLGWGRVAFEEFCALVPDPESGVSIVTLVELFRQPVPDPWWRAAVRHFARTECADLPAGYLDGYTIQVPLIETPVYMHYLCTRFERLGGKIEQRALSTLTELYAEGHLIVNCSGLGARELNNDPDVYPIRGQIVKVQAQHLPYAIIDDTNDLKPTYIVPRRDGCILGGTSDEHNASLVVDPTTTAQIQSRCRALQPTLRHAEILDQLVGLRPGRREVRLELEPVSEQCAVIHNYGHGGAGFTLSWGCAEEVRALANNWSSRFS